MRGDVIVKVADTLDRALTRVDVHPGWPGDRYVTDRMVWVGFDVRGELDIPVMTGGRKQYDDRFDFPLEIRVSGMTTPGDHLKECDRIMTEALSILQEDPGLGNLDGVIAAVVEDMRGPSVEVTPDGPIAYGQVTVQVHLRIL